MWIIEENQSIVSHDTAIAWFYNTTTLLNILKEVEEFVINKADVDIEKAFKQSNTEVSFFIRFLV